MRSAYSNKQSGPKSWYALDVKVPAAAAVAVEHALNELGSIGTEIDQLRKNLTEDVVVIGYFSERPEDGFVQDMIGSALQDFGFAPDIARRPVWRTVMEQDWLAEWKKHWKPTVIGRFVIAPPWEAVDQTEKILIRIEPNMAFGTGTHETTHLCLKAIDNFYEPGDSFLDVGTGTGILAIAAAKLATEGTENTEIEDASVRIKQTGQARKPSVTSLPSVARILACDTDADSVRIARENAEMNGVVEKINFFIGSIGSDMPVFDLVCANLTLDVIMPMLPVLLAKTRRSLVLSGILREQEQRIKDALAANGQKTSASIERAGEWIAMIVGRNKR